MATHQERTEQLIQLQGQALGVLRDLTVHVAGIAEHLKGLKGGAGTKPTPPATGATKAGGTSLFGKLQAGIGAVSKTFGQIGQVVGAVTGALSAVPNAVESIVNRSVSYVRALNPGLVQQYERETQNLRATIGYGLTPVIAYASKSLKEWAGMLLPGIQAIRPVVERLSAAVSGAASGVVRTLARVLETVAAQAAKVLPAYESMIDSLGAMFEAVAAVVEVLAEFDVLINLQADALKFAADALRQFTIAALVASAKLLKFFGANDTLGKFRASLERAVEERKNPKSGLLAAPTDSGTSGIEDIAKRMSERAFVATAGTGATKKSETDLLEEMVRQLKAVENLSPQDIRQSVKQGVLDALNPLNGLSLKPAPNAIPGTGPSTGGGAATGLRLASGLPGIGSGVAVSDLRQFFSTR